MMLVYKRGSQWSERLSDLTRKAGNKLKSDTQSSCSESTVLNPDCHIRSSKNNIEIPRPHHQKLCFNLSERSVPSVQQVETARGKRDIRASSLQWPATKKPPVMEYQLEKGQRETERGREGGEHWARSSRGGYIYDLSFTGGLMFREVMWLAQSHTVRKEQNRNLNWGLTQAAEMGKWNCVAGAENREMRVWCKKWKNEDMDRWKSDMFHCPSSFTCGHSCVGGRRTERNVESETNWFQISAQVGNLGQVPSDIQFPHLENRKIIPAFQGFQED